MSMRAWTEFEIQAAAYYKLRGVYGWKRVYGEHRIKPRDGRRGARIDILITAEDNQTPILAIEVKRGTPGPASTGSKQQQRYQELLDCPCIIVQGMPQALNVVEAVRAALAVP